MAEGGLKHLRDTLALAEGGATQGRSLVPWRKEELGRREEEGAESSMKEGAESGNKREDAMGIIGKTPEKKKKKGTEHSDR